MSDKTAQLIKMTEDLIINNIEDLKLKLLEDLKKCNKLEITLSAVDNIDISGLQLLISLTREVENIKKDVIYSGQLKASFLEDINRIAFAPNIITNGEDLQRFINDTI